MRMVHAAGLPHGSYIIHCAASEAVLQEETPGQEPGVTTIHMPVLLLTSQALLVMSDGWTRVATSIPLPGAAPAPVRPTRKHVRSGTSKAVQVIAWTCLKPAVKGCSPALAGARLSSNHLGSQLWLEGGMRDAAGNLSKLQASVPSGMWHVLLPLLREHIRLTQQ